MLPSQKGNTGVTERKSIYDFLSGKMDIGKEVQKIAHLFESVDMVIPNVYDDTLDDYTLENFISNKLFPSWKGRRTYLTSLELKTDMGIADIQEHLPSELQTISYLEYVINMINLFNLYETKKYLISHISHDSSVKKDLYQALNDNISHILSQLNLESVQKMPDVLMLIPKDPVVFEAVEIVKKYDVKHAILEYNHITNRNNLTEKRKILNILAHDFEPKRLELKETSYGKNLASDLFCLFNNLDIRHNDTEGKKAIPAIQTMSEENLLEWYDTTYRLYLTAVLLHDYSNEELQAKITDFKKAVKSR